MVVRDVVERLALDVVAGGSQLHRTVTGGYVGDLLSCAMAKASNGDVWVTVQGHPNVVAVAVLVEISAIIVSEGAKIEASTVEKAEREGVPILSSRKASFGIVKDLVEMGLRGGEC